MDERRNHVEDKGGSAAAGVDKLRTEVSALRDAVRPLRNEAVALGHELRRPVRIARLARTSQAKRRRRLWYAGVGSVGFLLFPLVAAFAPGGHLATLATRQTDRWISGTTLMRKANPKAWRELTEGENSAQPPPEKSPSHILAGDDVLGRQEDSAAKKPEIGTVPTLPGACPILGDCALPGDDLREKRARQWTRH